MSETTGQPTMFLVHVGYKNGATETYTFTDMGLAQSAADTCAAAKTLGHAHPPRESQCKIFDQGGRQAWMNGAEMRSVQLVDVEQAVYMDTRARIIAGRTERHMLELAGEGPVAGQRPNGAATHPEHVDDRQPRRDAPPPIGSFTT